jgi:hypothetical protein
MEVKLLSLSPRKERRLRVAENVLRRIDVPKERKRLDDGDNFIKKSSVI